MIQKLNKILTAANLPHLYLLQLFLHQVFLKTKVMIESSSMVDCSFVSISKTLQSISDQAIDWQLRFIHI